MKKIDVGRENINDGNDTYYVKVVCKMPSVRSNSGDTNKFFLIVESQPKTGIRSESG